LTSYLFNEFIAKKFKQIVFSSPSLETDPDIFVLALRTHISNSPEWRSKGFVRFREE